ncbi:MAG: AAA family ATPase [Bacteroidetes bacterium]|nr:AAA family ATPase [Bacteroidota bacterium]
MLQKLELIREKIPSFDRYPFNLPALRQLKTLTFHPKVTYLTGENGMGKSTLIEAIAVANGYNAEGGSSNFNFSTRSSHSELHEYIRIGRGGGKFRTGFFLRSESFFNLATEIENLDEDEGRKAEGGKSEGRKRIIESYGGKSLHEQSHGESFWALFMNRFSGNGLYILDEPEAALSPTRQMAMLVRMHELIGQQSQFIIATHSPIAMAYPSSTIYELSENGIQKTAYTETQNYMISKEFLNNHTGMLRILLDEKG